MAAVAGVQPLALGLAAIVPFLIAVSYPAVFVAGGISLALAPTALGSGRRTVRMGWVVFNLLLVAAFLSVYLASTVFQAAAILDEYRKGCWADSFPPLDRPWLVPVWLLDVHAGQDDGLSGRRQPRASAVTLLCVLAGCMILRRQGRTAALAVMIAPAALGRRRCSWGDTRTEALLINRRSTWLRAHLPARGSGTGTLLSLIRTCSSAPSGISGKHGDSGDDGRGSIMCDVAMPYACTTTWREL